MTFICRGDGELKTPLKTVEFLVYNVSLRMGFMLLYWEVVGAPRVCVCGVGGAFCNVFMASVR